MATVLVVALVGLTPAPARADEDGNESVRVVGQMERPSDYFSRPMTVDEGRSLGFAAGGAGFDYDLYVMDLERLIRVAKTPTPMQPDTGTQRYGFTPESNLALDPARERLYVTGTYPEVATAQTCKVAASTSGPRRGQPVFDYRAAPDGRRSLDEKRIGPMPCTGAEQSPFYGLVGSYDQDHKLLYVGGTSASEVWRSTTGAAGVFSEFLGGTFREDRGQSLLLRQLAIGQGDLAEFADSFAPNAPSLHLDWELDLRLAGCGRRDHVSATIFEGFVGRLGDDVLAYCWDARPYRGLQQGQQGYLVKIPLALDPADGVMKPQARSGGPAVADPATGRLTDFASHRAPTLPGDVTVILDRASGRLMLVTTGTVNGNAVWVFDPKTERFVGVITGGYADQPEGNTAVGFDSAKGRVYVLTKNGLLIAPIRANPLPAGLIYPVLVNTEGTKNFVGSNRISVAPALGRLFVDKGTHYEVLEDRVADPPPVTSVDPDSLTTQVAEEDGKTESSASGQALASGAHVVNAGGAPRLVGQSDPTCRFDPPNTELADPQHSIPPWEIAPALFGSCLPELLVSAGHREASAAPTELEAGTGSGASARGSAFAFGSTDTGTDSDIRRFTDCGADTPDRVDRWGREWPLPDDARLSGGSSSDPILSGGEQHHQDGLNAYNDGRDQFWEGFAGSSQFQDGQDQYRGGCNDAQGGVAGGGGPDLRAGTKGADGKGFPVPAAICGDFGGHPTGETWPAQTAGQPQVGDPTSSATCDASGPTAQGQASAGALALPSATDPQLSVSRVWSKVSSVRTEEGQVTMALAVAEGVTAGPLSIAQVRSLAITSAHGHTDTASAALIRQWCGIRIADQAEQGCVDPDTQEVKALLDELNAATLQKVQLSVPQGSALATPGGYQAVVTKHPAQRGGDQAVNDDDSHTISALQAVVYNDGPRGRSRLIVQLAGVHAESRYGIIELPNFDFDFGPDPDPGPTQEPGTEPAPVEPVALPAAPAPLNNFTPANFVDEGPFEVQRTFSVPAPRIVRLPPVRGPVKYLRIPVQALTDAIQLLVQHPGEFALLFVTWSLLAAPLYLGLRRRSFARALIT